MNRLNQLQWPLIIGLGAFALLRPFMNITGMMDFFGRPFGQLFITLLISAAWLLIVVLFRVREPLLTLVCTGVVHGLFAFILGVILSPLLAGEMFAPFANPFILPFAVTGILVTNALWGLAVGLVAWVIQRSIQPSNQQES